MASDFVLIGSSAEATGHPSNCSEPANGTVRSTSSTSVSINKSEVATKGTAELFFSSHAHTYNMTDGCIDNQSHTLQPNTTTSVTINGESLYLNENSVATDPGSGGSVNITGTNGNSTVGET